MKIEFRGPIWSDNIWGSSDQEGGANGWLEQTLTLHSVLFHVLDLSNALTQVGGEASSVLLAGCCEDDQYLALAARIGRRQSDSVGVVWRGRA